jgi:hypothetical protein
LRTSWGAQLMFQSSDLLAAVPAVWGTKELEAT